jgi:hypothetical protein
VLALGFPQIILNDAVIASIGLANHDIAQPYVNIIFWSRYGSSNGDQ